MKDHIETFESLSKSCPPPTPKPKSRLTQMKNKCSEVAVFFWNLFFD